MRVLFFSYWEYNEGLTASTSIPHVKILAGLPHVRKVIFSTVERSGKPVSEEKIHPKVKHIPLYSKSYPLNVLNKVSDVFRFRKMLIQIIQDYDITHLICRTSPAGGIGYRVHQKMGIPFYVESFEPHADYMLEAGVWKRYSLKYLTEKYWEEKILQHAEGIMPVNHFHKKDLVSRGVYKNKIHVMPCCTPIHAFKFSPSARKRIRANLGIANGKPTAIYVGKFGGNYYYQEAFDLFATAKKAFNDYFFLIILTGHNPDYIHSELINRGFNQHEFMVQLVPHKEVPHYLSAADFAFSTLKFTPSKRYLSAIKHGEYWANGLPLILSKGIGEDSKIVEENQVGGIFDIQDLATIQEAFNRIQGLLETHSREELSKRIQPLAETHRNFSINEGVYKKVFSEQK